VAKHPVYCTGLLCADVPLRNCSLACILLLLSETRCPRPHINLSVENLPASDFCENTADLQHDLLSDETAAAVVVVSAATS